MGRPLVLRLERLVERVDHAVLSERRLAEAIARPLLSFAASGGLEKFGDWQPLKQAKGAAAWGQCPRAVPPRPEEKWDGTRRSYDVTESNAFERAMRERPHFWASHVHEGTGAVRLSAEPEVAAHRAAAGGKASQQTFATHVWEVRPTGGGGKAVRYCAGTSEGAADVAADCFGVRPQEAARGG